MKGQMKIGTYTGTGAAIHLELGFIPDFFLTVNITDGDDIGLWFNGMTADTGIDIAAAVAGNANNAFTADEGSAGTYAKGITIGTDYSENAKVWRYVAFANQ